MRHAWGGKNRRKWVLVDERSILVDSPPIAGRRPIRGRPCAAGGSYSRYVNCGRSGRAINLEEVLNAGIGSCSYAWRGGGGNGACLHKGRGGPVAENQAYRRTGVIRAGRGKHPRSGTEILLATRRHHG